MEKSKTRKTVIKGIIFILIGILLFELISTILLPEWINNQDVSLTIRGFYEEPKNSLDVIFVGNSNVYRGISPMVLWKEKGITSYNVSSPIQKMWISYYFIKEMYQYQNPKIIMLDMDEVFNDDTVPEQSMRKALDNMRFGRAKWETINDPIFQQSFFDKLSYLFPVLRYHSRWNKLTARDFARPMLKWNSTFKGYLATKQVTPFSKKVDYMKKRQKPIPSEKPTETSKKYLEKIIQLCKEKQTTLILMELPSLKTWSIAKNEGIQEMANQYQIPFLDFNTIEIGIDWNTDTEDAGYHLNRSGAEKVTKYLANYLATQYNLSNHKQEEEYLKWNSDLEKYEQQP